MPLLKRWTIPAAGVVAALAIGYVVYVSLDLLTPPTDSIPTRASEEPVASPVPPARTEPAKAPVPAPRAPEPAPAAEPNASRLVFDRRQLSERERAFFGIVSEEGGGPVDGAIVELTPSQKSFDSPQVEVAQKTDAEGKFLAAGLKEESYTVRVSAPGLVSAVYYNIRKGKELNVGLRRGATVSGRVLAEKGEVPLGGALVEGFAREWKEAVRAGPDGTYQVLAPREAIALVATADGYEQFRVDNVLPMEGPTVDFKLKEGVTVSGRVIGGDTKQPLAGARVATGIPFFNRKEHGETNREGRFQIRGLSRGGTMLMIHAQGYTEKIEQVVLDSDKKDLSIELDPSSSVEGRVTESGGKPVARAGIFCSEKNAIAFLTVDSTPKAHTDAEGKFRLTGINAKKEYIVNAEAEGFVRGQSKPLFVEPGKEYKNIDIVLTNGGVLAGRVQDAEGKPIAGADLKIQVMQPPAGDLVWIARELQKTKDGSTGEDGTFRLTGVRPGKVKLFVSAEKYLRREDLEFDVAEGGAVQNILINLEKGYMIAGRVTDLNGHPVQRAQVYASGAYPTPSYGTTETGPEGYYRIMSLKGGRFTVNVRAAGYETKMKTEVDADDENVDFVIAKNGSISGRVTASAGAVPVERFRVTLNVVGGSPEGGGGGAPTFSKQKYFNAKDGKYTVEDVGQGLYEVVVSSDDFAPKSVPGVQVRQGEETTAIDVVLEEGSTVEGWVRDRAGSPAENAIVYLQRVRPDTGEVDWGAERKTARVEPTGTYRIKGIAPGRYDVIAQAQGFCDGASQPVTVSGDRLYPVSFVLYRGGSFTLMIVTEGTPLPGANIRMSNQNGQPVFGGAGVAKGGATVENTGDGMDASGTGGGSGGGSYTGMPTNETGKFESGTLCPGNYTITIEKDGFTKVDKTIRVEDERHITETVTLVRSR